MTSPAPGVSSYLVVSIVLSSIALAALLARALDRRRRRDVRRQDAELRRLMRAFLGDAVGSEHLMRVVRSADAGAYWSALEAFSFALRHREWRRLSRALAREPHAAAERLRLADDSPWRQVLAARRLGLLRSLPSRRALRRALRRGPALVTLAAGSALGRYRDLAALRWLLAHPGSLAGRTRPALTGLLRAFGRRGIPEIAADLERGQEEETLTLAALEVVGQGRHRPVRATLERLLGAGSVDVRVAAARALGQLGALEAASALLAALADPSWQVRAQAAKALGRIEARLAVDDLARRLTDSSWWVRRHAAYALVLLGREGRDALERVRATSPDPYAREMAEEALEHGARRDVA